MEIKDSNIAIVHDWFLKKSFSGAEKVTLLIENFLSKNYSNPDIFSLTSNIENLEGIFSRDVKIKTSFIQSIPFGKTNIQKFLPILPFAIEQLNLDKYDLIISSSHAFAKGIITNPYQLHISYIHTPMRYAWDQMNIYLDKSALSKKGFEILVRYCLYKLREWDFSSSQRIDNIIANSNFTAKRIKKYWGLHSFVINPPVDIERFNCNKTRGDFYLSVNRLVPNKRIDLLIEAFNKSGLPLIILGDGPEKNKLKKMAKSNVKFLGQVPDLEIEYYMSTCRAFVYAGLEDFGIAPVEAIASGAPIIAFGKGGILDTVNCLTKKNENKISTGLLFRKQNSLDIFDTIDWFEDKKIWKEFNPQTLNNYAQKFSKKNFTKKFDYFINKCWEQFKSK